MAAKARRPLKSAVDRGRLIRAAARVATILVFAVLPVVLTATILSAAFVRGPFLYDYRGGLYEAGTAIVHGHDPYRVDFVARQAASKRAGEHPDTVISVPVYPAPTLLAATPLSLLPYRVSGIVFTLLSIAGLLAGLRLLGVRDWRCYGLAFCTWPVLHGLLLGALTPLLVLGAAIGWRCRDRLPSAAVSIATIVVAKLFLWPLLVWLATTRRLRTLGVAVVLSVVGTLGAWAAIGFDGLAQYPRMLANLSAVSENVGVSLGSGLLTLGFTDTGAELLAGAAAASLLAAAWVLSRRPDGDRRSFGLVMVAALVASPIVWPHYFALALVPIALASPTLSPLWLTPLLAYLAPSAQTTGRPWEIVPYLAIVAIVAFRLCSSRPLASDCGEEEGERPSAESPIPVPAT